MSNLTPYEKELAQQLNNLPLPNEDLAWQEMKGLLDEDDKKRGIPPPSNNNNIRNIFGGLAILVFLMTGLWIGVHHKKQVSTTNSSQTQARNIAPAIKNISTEKTAMPSAKDNADQPVANNNNAIEKNSAPIINKENDPSGNDINGSKKNAVQNSAAENKPGNKENIIVANTDVPENKKPAKKKNAAYYSNNISSQKRSAQVKNKLSEDGKLNTPNKNIVISKKGNVKFSSTSATVGEAQDSADVKENTEVAAVDKTIAHQQAATTSLPVNVVSKNKDSAVSKPVPSTIKDTPVVAKKPTVDNKKKRDLLSVGVGEQQFVRLDCHCVYPDDNYNSRTKLTDYLPSVYVRFSPAKKWFLQTEFKYAAPQFVDEFVYKTQVQNQPLNYIITSFTLKKVYDQQVSLSVNYLIFPSLSIGTGIIYNGFSGAVIQQDVRKKLYGLETDSLISSKIINEKDDSAFARLVKNNIQALFETQYKWKHLSLGMRYAVGMQPYIAYTDPYLHLPAQKKNNSLNIFLRYELWKK